ncbi:hypothetical protein NIES4074_54580 [Cylindrospermum sp. NIES-4074]|nr:hypothetical protein NIES4074_54580 [Cylindrospermum sp. NIES-4074]
MPKAGSSIRKMAFERTTKAVVQFCVAGGLAVAPLLIPLLLPIPPGVGVLIWVGCLVGAAAFYQQGSQLWSRANQATQGAIGEEKVAQILKVLEPQGWKIEYNIPLKRWGDADVFIRSPKGNYFVIDTKSNKGGVFFDGSVLKRRFGKNIYEFSGGKNLLKAVAGQAITLRDMKQVKFVQPILCFTQANLEEIKQNQDINGVYIVASAKLVNLLKKLDS